MGLLKAMTLLPFSVQIRIGELLGRLLLVTAKRRRHIAEVNLETCFPELSVPERQLLLRKTFAANAIGMIETAMAWFIDIRRFKGRYTITGIEPAIAAIESGRGVLMLGGHYTTLDIAGKLLGTAIPYNVIYRPQKNPVIQHIMVNARQEFLGGGQTIVQNNVRGMIKSLSTGQILWYPPDQDHGAKHGVFAPFFNEPAAVVDAPSRMAKKADALVMMLHYYREPDGHYRLNAYPLENFPTTDPVADATTINEHLEGFIRKCPEQYMWVHRRFKSRPPGEGPLY